jgi:hypothetical protein
MKALGKKLWAIADGLVPSESNGPEPKNTSHDRLSILNTTSVDAHLKIMIYYADRDPKGPYELIIKGSRVRQIRINDLIEPEAIPLDTPYGCTITSSVPIIVQFSRLDTGLPPKAIFSTLPYSAS